MPTLKDGTKVSWRELWKRFKKGMQEVTPYQQATSTQLGQIVSAIGVVWGIIFSIRLDYWWMMIILIGGLIILSAQYLGNWQKKIILKQVEDAIKLADIKEEITDKEVLNGN